MSHIGRKVFIEASRLIIWLLKHFIRLRQWWLLMLVHLLLLDRPLLHLLDHFPILLRQVQAIRNGGLFSANWW